ncbi:MAG: hypothetical protein ACREUG_11185, partial [Steroidobacteraceae bacterium]
GPRDELRFLVGHRFFGRTYEAAWQRESRLLRLQVSYTEMPTTQDESMMQAPLAAAPLVRIPGTLGFTRLSPDVYLDKSLKGAATLTGRLTEIGLSVSSDERSYYAIATPGGLVITPRRRIVSMVDETEVAPATPDYEDHQRSATLYANRRFGPFMTASLSATYSKDDLREGALAEYETQLYSATLMRQLGQRSSIYLRAQHVRQYGQVAAYSANVVSLGFNISFGHGPIAQTLGAGTGYGQY